MITPERLHGGVVHYAHRFPEGFSKIEADPAFPKVLRVNEDPATMDRCRKTDRDYVELPITNRLLRFGNHSAWAQSFSRIEFPAFPVPRNHQLHVRPADVDNQNPFHLHRSVLASVIGVN